MYGSLAALALNMILFKVAEVVLTIPHSNAGEECNIFIDQQEYDPKHEFFKYLKYFLLANSHKNTN